MQEGELAQAHRQMERAKQIVENSEVLNGLGVLATLEGNLSAGRSHFEKALERAPKMVEALIGLGAIETTEKHFTQARRLLEYALSLDDKTPWRWPSWVG
jgi:Flp pilus assembly protein TadD